MGRPLRQRAVFPAFVLLTVGVLDVGMESRAWGSSVSTYPSTDGGMYVASLVEVSGPGHDRGDPIVGFYRVHDGMVIRHIFIYAPDAPTGAECPIWGGHTTESHRPTP